MISLASDHLRSCIARGATSRLESGGWFVHVAEAEVNNLQGQIVVQEQVLGLQVSVADSTLVDVLDARDELEVKLAGLLLREPRVSDDVVEQLAAIAVLHYHVELLFGFNYFVQLNDIRVSDLLEDFDLPSDSLHVFLIVDFVLLEDFDCYFFASQSVLAQLDLSKGSFAEMLA